MLGNVEDMPIVEFRCENCGHHWKEHWLDVGAQCPKCGDHDRVYVVEPPLPKDMNADIT